MRFRRKSDVDDAPETSETGAENEAETVADGDPAAEPAGGEGGPFDADDLPDDGVPRIDLGALLVAPAEGRDLRVQVDEKTGTVRSVVLAGKDGAVELRAYAAPRNGDLWGEVRPQIAADAARRGGTATENDGPFGTELFCEMQVKNAEGKVATQPSRVIGFNGPRWLLRATFLGRPAVDAEALDEWCSTVTRVAVRRGAQAMPVGEQLPLTLPAEIQRVQAEQAGQAAAAGDDRSGVQADG
ncbi:DUF3710 domain-containing protein [Nocardioides silvaticus]|uniref:DUF3710 domain-containing protein n=1 Tax=Nocardioides silvaticus TaxID=2201891 RepID=A0A316TK73_9ACTN|nr:DUF3710 domain-containing protein [Nocardioides silvaticus]PWN03659.1 DUF3710 domain-containing protein [Nocardioides silvaticus]